MAVRDYLIGAPQAGQAQVQTQGFAPEVLKLAGQLTQQRARAGIGQPTPPKPGLIQKIFDVIQRPLYASANTADYLVKGKNPLEGAASGIWGTEKTTYDKVLGDMGMSGGWQRSLAGLGLYIGLDPLTYVSGGLVKGVTEGAATKAGLEAVAEAAGEMAPTELARRSTQLYEGAKSIDEAGGKVVAGMTKKAAKQSAADSIAGDLMTHFQSARDAAIADGRGKMILKFMGKPIPGAESEALYKVGSKAAELTNKVPLLNSLNKNFRPTATYTQGTNNLLREAIGWSIFDGDNALTKLRNTFGSNIKNDLAGEAWGGLDAGQREMISHAIESGQDLSGHAVESTGKTLEDYRQAAMAHRDNLYSIETGQGIHAKQYMPDHVPHVYEGGTPEAQAAFAKGRKEAFKKWQTARDAALEAGKDVPDARPFMQKYSLAAAQDAGLKPMTDIRDILGHRTIESFNKQGTARFFHAVANEFGIPITADLPNVLKGKTLDAVKEQMGVKSLKSSYFKIPELSPDKGEVLFDPEIHSVLTNHLKTMSDSATQNTLLKHFDQVQNAWKLGMTAVNPGHHIRNFAGDVFLNWEDGVKNPLQYLRATKVLKNWETNPEMIIAKIGDRDITAREMMQHFSQFGGKSGFFRTEMAQSEGPNLLGKLGNLRQNPVEAVQQLADVHPVEKIRQLAEKREDWTRMAHFIDSMEKNGAGVSSIEDARNVARIAGQKVRKFNIDYGDLTQFERKFMKRTVPFYTWMRKNIPLQLETLAMDPGKINVIPKGMRALQNITGAQPGEENVFGLNVVPQWLRDMAGVRIAGEGMGRNQVYWNPSVFPAMDIAQYFSGGPQDVARSFLSASSPFIRTPFEYATGRSISTGAPSDVGGMSYAQSNLLPPAVPAAGALMSNLLAAAQGKGIMGGRGELTDLGKLAGLSFYNVGPQQQLGELRRQQDPIQALLKAQKNKYRGPRSWEQKK